MVLTLILCLFLSNTSAQSFENEINIPAQKSCIPELLEQVSAQCSCYFSYPSDMISDDKILTISNYQGKADIFIQSLFEETVSLETYKNQIIIKPEKENVAPYKGQGCPQDNIILKGNIVDSITQEQLPYVNISIQGSMLGSSTNSYGKFTLKIPTQYQDSTLVFSCLGYYSRSYKVADLSDSITVKMTVANISLQEVVVRSVSLPYIMEQMQRQLKSRYRREPYSYEAFYREISKREDDYISYNEALFTGYSPKGRISRDDLVLKKARQFKSRLSQDTLLLTLKGGTDAVLQLDIANYSPDFLDENKAHKYHYYINDIQVWHNDLVYIIEFRPLVHQEDAEFEGELYVAFQDYALLGARFAYTKEHLKKMKKGLVIRKSRQTRVLPHRYSYRVEYQKMNDQYHINYVKGDITIKARHKHQLRYTNLNTIFEMTMTQIDTTQTIIPKHIKPYKTKSIFSEQIRFSSEMFWYYDNLIIPEQEIMEAFLKSGFRMESQE